MNQNVKVLDIGCSSGNFDTIIMDRKNATVDGVELNKEDARIAATKLRKVFNINVETDDLKAIDTNYDVIYLGDVIEHLVDPSYVLEKLKHNLNKRGVVIFSIPNMAHISVRLMLLSGKFEYGETGLLDKTHLHYYDKVEIERLFHTAGYNIEKLDWVSRDIPKDILQKELSQLGLTANDKFFKLARDLDSAAYQYIGVAVPANGKINPTVLPKVSPEIDMFEKHLADIKQSYIEDVERLQKKHAGSNNADIELLTRLIDDYEKSTSWKITKPLRKVSKAVHKVRPKS
ncbi:MAG TPA: class I SAM-dependent methyltransferase [Candidatus Saccharimonadia bacterium]|nr:class I SAM-dependent methyltransferase [Candidatus Saccharimonadia bacterium]